MGATKRKQKPFDLSKIENIDESACVVKSRVWCASNPLPFFSFFSSYVCFTTQRLEKKKKRLGCGGAHTNMHRWPTTTQHTSFFDSHYLSSLFVKAYTNEGSVVGQQNLHDTPKNLTKSLKGPVLLFHLFVVSLAKQVLFSLYTKKMCVCKEKWKVLTKVQHKAFFLFFFLLSKKKKKKWLCLCAFVQKA